MTDAMEAFRQDVEQKAADELVGSERHHPLPLGSVAAVVTGVFPVYKKEGSDRLNLNRARAGAGLGEGSPGFPILGSIVAEPS